MKKIILVVVAAIIVIVVLSVGGKNSESVKIGGLYTLTGPIAAYGEFQKRAAELVVKEINDKGGIYGKPVELYIEDTASDAKKGVDAYHALKLKGVKFFVVEYSPVAAAVRELAVKNGNFLISSGATTPSYVDGNNLTCRITMTAKDIGPALASQLIKEKQIKASLLLPNNEYGKGLADEFTKAYTAQGGAIVISEFYDASGPSDFRTNITKIVSQIKNTDVLVTVNAANTAEVMLQQIKTAGWNKPIASDYNTTLNPAVKDIKTIEGITFVDFPFQPAPDVNDTAMVKSFKENYIKQFNQNPILALAGYYDGVTLPLYAIQKVGNDPQKVADYITTLKDYPTITGVIPSFDTDCQAEREYVMRKVVNSNIIKI